MISEPELEGSSEPMRGAGGTVEPAGPRPAVRRPAWAWALAGAAVASALWAGGLYVVHALGEKGPPLRYAHTGALCEKFDPAALRAVVGNVGAEREDTERRHAALDTAYCTMSTAATPEQLGSGQPYYQYRVGVLVERHKNTDPRTEFEVDPRRDLWSAATPDEVEGLGERALMTNDVRDGPRLRVLDGGVVLTVDVSWYWVAPDENTGEEGPERQPDWEAVKTAMVKDTATLLGALRTR
ncbi:hypothetical protein [Streptomyces sp. NPDC012888]|uniref:hypothetical protein n=1 Tax=Streptomyces sp. NPDC012888 TaxID=3364855 RepID=UPI0036C7247E